MIAFLSMPTEMPVIFDDSTTAWSFEISFGVAFFDNASAAAALLTKGTSS
jgi:hypothetical protein